MCALRKDCTWENVYGLGVCHSRVDTLPSVEEGIGFIPCAKNKVCSKSREDVCNNFSPGFTRRLWKLNTGGIVGSFFREIEVRSWKSSHRSFCFQRGITEAGFKMQWNNGCIWTSTNTGLSNLPFQTGITEHLPWVLQILFFFLQLWMFSKLLWYWTNLRALQGSQKEMRALA